MTFFYDFPSSQPFEEKLPFCVFVLLPPTPLHLQKKVVKLCTYYKVLQHSTFLKSSRQFFICHSWCVCVFYDFTHAPVLCPYIKRERERHFNNTRASSERSRLQLRKGKERRKREERERESERGLREKEARREGSI